MNFMKVVTMEKTEDLEIDIDDIGAILKSSRLKNKKSLEDVSSELCIRKIYLSAIEEGDYETLPPIPYGIGYVRTYANYLGLSSERAVKLYKAAALLNEEQNKVEEEVVVQEVNKGNRRHFIYGLIALLILYFCWGLLSHGKKAPVENAETTNIVVEEALAPEESIENIKEEKADKPAEENINKEDLDSKDEAKEATEEVVTDNKVRVVFNGESWVELKRKNKVYFQGVFHKGDVKEIDYIDNLFVSVGRPKNVEIYVNGVKKNHLAKRRKTNIPVDSLE